MGIPIDPTVKEIKDIPYTISYVIRKRMQIDNLAELQKEKRPPDNILWDGTGDELEAWLDRVLERNGNDRFKNESIIITDDMIEG